MCGTCVMSIQRDSTLNEKLFVDLTLDSVTVDQADETDV